MAESGIVADVKGLAAAGLRAVRTRLELMAIELKEEKAWAMRSLVIAVSALYLVTFGMLLAVFALVLWASEENRPAILAAFAIFFIAGGIGEGLHRELDSRRSRSSRQIAVEGRRAGLDPHLRATGD